MINRIRDIRLQKGLTLADVAAACAPPTTAQTIGRLETGTRTLSLAWMNRIAAALGVAPEVLVHSERTTPPTVVAVLDGSGAQPVAPRTAVQPSELAARGDWLIIDVEAAAGDYRAGDQLWMRSHPAEHAAELRNRDALAPLPGGRFAFGRVARAGDGDVVLLPPAAGSPPIAVEHPPWLAVAEMLVRKL